MDRRNVTAVRSGMFAINKVKAYVPIRVLRTLYFTLVYPYIIYGITLWIAAYQAHLSKSNVFHKKIIGSIFNANIMTVPKSSLYS